MGEDDNPEERVSIALNCLPPYAAPSSWTRDADAPFCYWRIRDFAYAYRSKLASPTVVSDLKIKSPCRCRSLFCSNHRMDLGGGALYFKNRRTTQNKTCNALIDFL